MGALSWIRVSRRVTGVVQQRELADLETMLEVEAGRQPSRNLLVMSYAIPAGIAISGGLSVFAAWVTGTRGMPLGIGAGASVLLAIAAWFVFYRLYTSLPPAKRRLRDLTLAFTPRYASFGNIILGEKALTDPFGEILNEVAGIYLRHSSAETIHSTGASVKVLEAIEDALSRLLEVAMKDQIAQTQALAWANPLVEELRLADKALSDHIQAVKLGAIADPLANLRDARAELETTIASAEELERHLKTQ